MQYCAKCFERKCKCYSYKIEIDYLIYPTIRELNRKGYKTSGCCSGHSNMEYLQTYIHFVEDVYEDLDSEHIQFESYNYRGIHVKKNQIVAKPEVIKHYKKKRTNKPELLKQINRELYIWAKALPNLDVSPYIQQKTFKDEYFDEECYAGDRSPWVLLKPGAENGKDVISDYMDVVDSPAIVTEYFIGPYNQIIRCDSESEINLDSRLKDALMFSPKMFAFGKNEELHLDVVAVRDSRWIVAYTHSKEGFYIDEDDLDDYLYEHPEQNTIAAFKWIYQTMMTSGCGICIFASGDTFVVFSNKTEFAYRVSSEYSAFLVGKIDYEEMELKHIRPESELFVFTNGTLLFREEF